MTAFTAAAIAECSRNEKEIYGFAKDSSFVSQETPALKNMIFLTLYGAQSKTVLGQITCTRDVFISEFLKVFKDSKLKAFVFRVDGSPVNAEFIRASRINLGILQIPFVYFTPSEYMRAGILIAANLSLKENDRIVEVLIDDNGYVVSELIYTENGFLECDQRDCKPYKKITPEAIRRRILGPNNPVKIVCHANSPGKEVTKFLKKNVLNNVPPSKVLIIEEPPTEYEEKWRNETIKWLFDKSYTKFYVCQQSFRDYMITFKYAGKQHHLLTCKKDAVLPLKQEMIIPRSFLQYFRACAADNEIDILIQNEMEISKEVHALKFTLEVDESNFMCAYCSGLIYKKISLLPTKLDAKDITFPVIGFCGELSFIYVKEEGAGYKFLDSWNGKLGKDLYISFDQEKPVFFEKAVQKFTSYSNSVIHDLIKVMSTAPAKLPSLQTFGYSITSDSDHPVLMTVDNHLGEKKSATPVFLMALLLKEHLKELQTKLGSMLNKIGFCIFDEFDGDSEAKKRVENGLKEVCQMLNGLECCFLDAV